MILSTKGNSSIGRTLTTNSAVLTACPGRGRAARKLVFFLGLLGISLVIWGARAAEQLYTSPGLGSYLIDPTDLVLENVQIVQESTLPGNRTLLQITGNMRNRDDGTWILVNAGPRGQTAYRFLSSYLACLLYTSPSPRDGLLSRMPSSA